jgi:hypothetical protein
MSTTFNFAELFEKNCVILKSDTEIFKMFMAKDSELFQVLNDNDYKSIISLVKARFADLAPLLASEALEALADGLNPQLKALLDDDNFIDDNIVGMETVDGQNDQYKTVNQMSDYYQAIESISNKLNKIFNYA